MKIVDEELNKMQQKNDDLKERILAANKEYAVCNSIINAVGTANFERHEGEPETRKCSQNHQTYERI